ncbi:TnpV protein [Blautia glucerasea]|uniref:TnpV protein n=1 Tax=Blautia glucerasea TaxID=536633 RepID=UPI0015715BC9|nr:TnpV protein [Blautia glucerasea]NSJ28467.1 TnpV protein [Blautia glucerasea]
MTKKKHIYDENNRLSYTLHGDYYLPDLAVNEEEPTYGKYGMLRKQFLKVHRPARYQYLLMTGELTAHLNRVDQEAREQVKTLVKQMVKKQGVEQLKMQDLMKWVGLMNNIKACAEEIVLQELVYM